MTELERFLREQGLFDRFKENCKGRPDRKPVQKVLRDPVISGAFTWCKTPEGHDFWEDVQRKFSLWCNKKTYQQWIEYFERWAKGSGEISLVIKANHAAAFTESTPDEKLALIAVRMRAILQEYKNAGIDLDSVPPEQKNPELN